MVCSFSYILCSFLLNILSISQIPIIISTVLISSETKILGQSNANKKKDTMMEKQATAVAEVGCHSDGGVATVSQQVVSLNEESKTTTLKEFTYSELRTATMNLQHDREVSVRFSKGGWTV